MLARLLLHASGVCSSSSAAAAAAATLPGCATQLQRLFTTSTSSSTSSNGPAPRRRAAAPSKPELTPEQQQHVDTLRYLVSRPLEAAHNAALLTALTASYRDLYAVMDQFHKKDILGIPQPLLDEPPPAASQGSSSSSSRSGSQQHNQQSSSPLAQQTHEQQEQLDSWLQAPGVNHTQASYPLRDLTTLPDELPPPEGFYRYHLQEKHMTSINAHAQLLPNHLEVSYAVTAFIFLWPPMEMFYPFLADPGDAMRYLKPHFKRVRDTRSRNTNKVRCHLGWRRKKPMHKQRVFGLPQVPPALRLS